MFIRRLVELLSLSDEKREPGEGEDDGGEGDDGGDGLQLLERVEEVIAASGHVPGQQSSQEKALL